MASQPEYYTETNGVPPGSLDSTSPVDQHQHQQQLQPEDLDEGHHHVPQEETPATPATAASSSTIPLPQQPQGFLSPTIAGNGLASPPTITSPPTQLLQHPAHLQQQHQNLQDLYDGRSPMIGGDEDDDPHRRIHELEQELNITRQEKDTLGNQYRTLLGKLTAMRQSLGDKLREDAEELDRREGQITHLTTELSTLQQNIETLQSELLSTSTECAHLTSQLTTLRSSSTSSSSEVHSLTKELRELRGEMERLRVEREEWEAEAGNERARREESDEEIRRGERRWAEGQRERINLEETLRAEKERAENLQDVLGEFQAAKDLELRQATTDLETQLKHAANSLQEYKQRAATAESRLGELSSDATKTSKLEREIKEKNATIGRLRHEAVLTQEHLTEALRRLRRNTSDTNVDRRLVTNILLQFLMTPRADPKRFEMLSLLSTILSWEDADRIKAGLQRRGEGSGTNTPTKGKKGKESEQVNGRTKEEEDTFNESFSNLFVEFLLKEAAQGETRKPNSNNNAPSSSHGNTPGVDSPPLGSPGFTRPRTLSTASSMSGIASGFRAMTGSGFKSPPPLPQGIGSIGRKPSYGLQQALQSNTTSQSPSVSGGEISMPVSPSGGPSVSPGTVNGGNSSGHVPLPKLGEEGQ